jgi:hypothetical protein
MRLSFAARWPTGLALIAVAGCIALIVLKVPSVELAPSVATMTGMYLVAYALNRPAAVWVAFPVLSVVTALTAVLGLNGAVSMTIVLVGLWLWTLIAGRARDGRLFAIETIGTVAFGAITLATLAVDPRIGGVLTGIGFFSHGLWDIAHFRADKVVNRPWSEFCAVIDLPVGVTLITAALLQ